MAFAETEVSYGKAYSSKGELLYTEKHVTVFKDKKMVSLNTTYYGLDKKEFASLSSDFTDHLYLPNYTFTDSRFGRRDGLKKGSSLKKVIAFAKPTKNAETKEKAFVVKPFLITGQGLHSYMNQNLQELVTKKEPTPIEFLIPMNQKSYNFEIVRLLVDDKKVVFKVKIKSWVLSLFAPYLKVTYELSTNRLLIFEGPSNIVSASRKNQNVKIVYSYDQKEKK